MGPEDHIQVDLADPQDVERAIGEMKTRLKDQNGRLDALVNNAAISPKKEGGERFNSIETPLEDWQTVFEEARNVRGRWYHCEREAKNKWPEDVKNFFLEGYEQATELQKEASSKR